MESLAPRVHQILQSVIVQHTTWQKFGDNFERLLRKIPKKWLFRILVQTY